jgi:CRISPR-associated endonuclease/helicase Cas3
MQDEQLLRELKPYPASGENKLWGGHAGVSQATISVLHSAKFVPEIVGQHHGYAPNLSMYTATSEVFGGDAWH